MTSPTPDQLLRLARAAMPKDEHGNPTNWVVADPEHPAHHNHYDHKNTSDRAVIDYRHEVQGWYDGPTFMEFDPISNSAHAWAVFKFLIGRYDRNDMDANDWFDEPLEKVVLDRALNELNFIDRMERTRLARMEESK